MYKLMKFVKINKNNMLFKKIIRNEQDEKSGNFINKCREVVDVFGKMVTRIYVVI